MSKFLIQPISQADDQRHKHFDQSTQLTKQAPPNIRKTSTEKELGIDRSIKCSFLWSSYKTKMFVNKLGSLCGVPN